MSTQNRDPARYFSLFALTINLIIAVVFCIVLFVGREEVKPLDVADRALDVKETLDEVFKDKERISFLSYNGTWHGTDGEEVEIVLKSNGDALLIETDLDLRSYRGKYLVRNGTELLLELKEYDNWPPMYLVEDNANLVLFPTDSSIKSFFDHEVRERQSYAGNFWPMREMSE